jgi:hypothetical protein
MKHQDVIIAGVTRNKFDEMIYRIKVKPGDYTTEEFEVLRDAWEVGTAYDIELTPAKSSNPPTTQTVDQGTGEVL